MGRNSLPIIFVLLAATTEPDTGRSLDLAACEERFGETARCGWMEVPEDRGMDGGRRIAIRVVLLPSAEKEPKEPLLLFPGGPGQATPTLIPVARQVYPRVQESRDVLFVGQRGAGDSHPLDCLEEIAGNPALILGQLWDAERIGACHARALEAAEPSRYVTADYVADVADVLDALGYGEVMLWGGSGGTRIAAAFIRAHPDRVVGAVLDGVTPLDYAMPLPFSPFAQRAWDRVVADCRAQADCAHAYPGLSGALDEILARLEAGSVTVEITTRDGATGTHSFHQGDFVYALRGILYDAGAIAGLPARIHDAAARGDLYFFAQALYDRTAAILGGVLSVGVHLSVYCAEDVPRIDDRAVSALTPGTFLGRYLVDQYRAACEAWPVDPVAESWYRPFRSEVPVLFVSGHYDPSTPEEAAETVRESFPVSRHLVIRNAAHGAGFGCARPTVEEFLVTGSLEGVENPCPQEPIRFEVPPDTDGS